MDGHEDFTEQEHAERCAYLDNARAEEEIELAIMDTYFNEVIEAECVHPFCLVTETGSAAYLETRGWKLRKPVKCPVHAGTQILRKAA